MQRNEDTIKMLQAGKVFVRLCYDFNVQDDVTVLNSFLTCGTPFTISRFVFLFLFRLYFFIF